MRHILVLKAVCMTAGLAFTQPAAADPSVKELAARAEVRAIETLTLSDQQFLTGDRNGKPATIAGELRLPQGASGRLPAVILMHGSGGPGPREEFWAKIFNEMGIASFRVDSFSGRGLTGVSANQTALYASLKRFHQAFDPEAAFAAYIPLYASCNATLIGDTEVGNVPVRLFH